MAGRAARMPVDRLAVVAWMMKIRLAGVLLPGDFAVILQPVTSRALAGERLFAGSALAADEGIIFGSAWPFHVS